MKRLKLTMVAALALGTLIVLAALERAADQTTEASAELAAPERIGHRPPGAFPEPIGELLGDLVLSDKKQRRKAWFAERHAAAPGVNWKAIEQANGLAQVAKRNELARAAAGPAPGSPSPLAGKASPWVERGSDNQAGRMHVARHSSDGTTLYAGSSLGGIWKGSLDGDDWAVIGDNLYGGAHELAVVPAAEPGGPDVVLAGAGGGLVHRSADDGATWEVPAGLASTWDVRRIISASDGSHAIYMVLENDGHYALMRSLDRAASFVEIYDFGDYRGDVWTPRTGGAALYLLDEGAIWLSADHGDTWQEVGAIDSPSHEGEVVGSEAGAPRLWVVLRSTEDDATVLRLFRSDDAGASFEFVTLIEDYWRSLAASIVDVDAFVYGGVEAFRTLDGGASFQLVNSWADYYANPLYTLHADIPGIDVVPVGAGQEVWYVSTDGGLYRSPNQVVTVENLSTRGLRVSQYYSTLTSVDDPNLVAAGSQDQGYQLTGLDAPDEQLLDFDQLISGDYGHLTSGDGTLGFVFSVYPGFVLAQVGADADLQLHTIDYPETGWFAWLPPVIADPEAPEDFFFLGIHLYRYAHNGAGAWTPQLWSELEVAAPDEHDYLTALAFSPVDPQRAYLATNRGRLFYSDDKGVTWDESASLGPGAHYFYGTAILAASRDEDTVLVAGSGYSGPAVYRSTDGGETFAPYGEGLPSTLVYCLAEAPDGSGRVFAGTETAAYQRDPDGDAWVDITGNAAPVTIYWSAEAVADGNLIRFGTYGRGIWDYPVPLIDQPDAGPGDTDDPWPAPDAGAVGFSALGGGCTCGVAPGARVPALSLLLSIALAGLAVWRSRR